MIDFNFYNICIASASLHGLIFGLFVVFSKKYTERPHKYLAYYILLVSLNNIYFWFLDTGIVAHYSWKYYWLFPIQWDLLMFPAFFYFIASYLGYKKLPQYYLFPFYISFPFCLFFLFQQVFFPDLVSANSVANFYLVLSFVSMFFTGFAIYKGYNLIVNYKKKKVLEEPKIEVNWLRHVLLFAMVVFFIWVLITLFNTLVYNNTEVERITTYVLWISMSLLIYWMGYLGIYHLGIFNQRDKIRAQKSASLSREKTKQKPAVSNKKYFKHIDQLVKKDKLYLHQDLSLQSLSEKLNLSEGYISQIINQHNATNFSDYINAYRIAESQNILTNPLYNGYTIVAIALESGFNSKSAFYNAFKKHVGMSPSAYKKKENMS